MSKFYVVEALLAPRGRTWFVIGERDRKRDAMRDAVYVSGDTDYRKVRVTKIDTDKLTVDREWEAWVKAKWEAGARR